MEKLKTLYYYIVAILLVNGITALNAVKAISVDVPPSQWQEDVAITWPTRVTWMESDLYNFIGVLNEYLWFTITVISFGALLYAGFKLITTRDGQAEGLTATLNVVKGGAIGIMLAVFSYLIVRLIINLL